MCWFTAYPPVLPPCIQPLVRLAEIAQADLGMAMVREQGVPVQWLAHKMC